MNISLKLVNKTLLRKKKAYFYLLKILNTDLLKLREMHNVVMLIKNSNKIQIITKIELKSLNSNKQLKIIN